jgi:hypothetical protein
MTALRPTWRPPALTGRPVPRPLRHGCLVVGYVVLGVLVTWPRVTYLASGILPDTRDQGAYVWDMWWMARQVEQLANPFSTHQIFAPVGVPLAYHDLMPLVGFVMTPITATAGPAVSVNLLSVLAPGLLSYAMYRAARLWLPPTGAWAGGAFFGLSSMLAWRAWFHLNIAIGALFLPLVLELAVRLRRAPSPGRAAVAGLVIGLCLLVDLESAVLAMIVAAAVFVDWLRTAPIPRVLGLSGVVAVVGLTVASPQIVAMAGQAAALRSDPAVLAHDYVSYGVALTQLFTPSPRVSDFGLRWLGGLFQDGITTEGMPTYGVALTVLAVLGAVLGWRHRHGWTWPALWLGSSVLALGPVLYLGTRAYTPLPTRDHGQTMSLLMPYTWLVRLPGLSGFREANRFTELGLLAAALLAGTAVAWLRTRFPPVLPFVAVLAVLELGWAAVGPAGTMPAGLPAVDHAVAADRSSSLVVDVPLGFRSGTLELGPGFPAEEQVEATLDGHPRAIGYLARLPDSTVTALRGHAFYLDLLTVQAGGTVPTAGVAAAADDARRMRVGWVLVWTAVTPGISAFLAQTGFSFRYRVDGVSVYGAATGGR